MNRVLKKRLPRDLRENLRRWLALFLMIALGMYIVTSVVGAAETIIDKSRDCARKNLVEDGEFSTFVPLTAEQEAALGDTCAALEQKFSLDIPQRDGSVIRVMKNRGKINRIALDEGRLADQMGEIVLEKRYCEEHGYSLGCKIQVSGHALAVVGIGTTCDYDLPINRFSDMSAESALFGTAFVTPEQYAAFLESASQRTVDYTYAYRLKNGKSNVDVKEAVKALTAGTGNLTSFVTADENPRILAAAGDMVMNRDMGLIAGIVVITLFAYVISVFIAHQINRESGVIGTLFALGAKKRELMAHYITLPTLITFFGGLTGAVLGFSRLGAARQMREAYAYFSIPVFETVYPVYLILYAVIMPPVISVIVNISVLNRRLSQTALSLIRNEHRTFRLSNVTLRGNNFVRNFRIRQTIRELRTNITILVGMFVSLLVFMLGLNCFSLCENVKNDSAATTKYEYMYTLKFPSKAIPEGAAACYAESLSMTERGYTLDISLIGIDGDNQYFDARPSDTENNIVIGKSVAEKYGVAKGGKIILTEKASETDYAFHVEDICSYSAGLAVFMDIDCMRALFGREDGCYNTLLSDKPLDLDAGSLYSVTSRSDILRSASVFTDMMAPMITMILSVSVIIFFAVMYLMTGVMIDRSSAGISLIKIFGFRTGEIRSLYLYGNAFALTVGALICIPLAKCLIDAVYPWAVANVACGLNLRFAWYFYPMIVAGILLNNWIVITLLTRRIDKISPTEVLKNRE